MTTMETTATITSMTTAMTGPHWDIPSEADRRTHPSPTAQGAEKFGLPPPLSTSDLLPAAGLAEKDR